MLHQQQTSTQVRATNGTTMQATKETTMLATKQTITSTSYQP